MAIGKPGKADHYSVMTGRGAWKKELIKTFPKDAEAIEKFFNLLQVSECEKSQCGYETHE